MKYNKGMKKYKNFIESRTKKLKVKNLFNLLTEKKKAIVQY